MYFARYYIAQHVLYVCAGTTASQSFPESARRDHREREVMRIGEFINLLVHSRLFVSGLRDNFHNYSLILTISLLADCSKLSSFRSLAFFTG